MFATTDLVPLLAERGVSCCPGSRSTGWSPRVPERLSLTDAGRVVRHPRLRARRS